MLRLPRATCRHRIYPLEAYLTLAYLVPVLQGYTDLLQVVPVVRCLAILGGTLKKIQQQIQAARMPSTTLFPFFGGVGSLINPFKQKRAPFLILGYWAT